MIETLILFQPKEPVFTDWIPTCPKCYSEDIATIDKGSKGFCRDCHYKDNIDEF
jgi:hypothetical protein